MVAAAPSPKLPAVGHAMEFNRNHYFMLGLVLLFLGIQFRLVEGVVLNEKVSQALAHREAETQRRSILAAIGPSPHHTVHLPSWLGWALMSTGSVLVLHSLAMKKPGG
jgi:hypothetical protein